MAPQPANGRACDQHRFLLVLSLAVQHDVGLVDALQREIARKIQNCEEAIRYAKDANRDEDSLTKIVIICKKEQGAHTECNSTTDDVCGVNEWEEVT